MRILKVFNNSIVLARDDEGRAVVVLGSGVGFRAHAGAEVDESRVTHRFVPDEGQSATSLSAFIAALPPEHIALASDVLDLAAAHLDAPLPQSAIVPLADHIVQAIKRFRDGELLDYPLAAEVRYVYPRELEVAHAAVDLIRRRTRVDLPADEAVPITLHLVNAASTTLDMPRTFEMTTILSRIFATIEESFGKRLDRRGLATARFITHLRYFLARVREDSQLIEMPTELSASIASSYPHAHICAEEVGRVIHEAIGIAITPDEHLYLTLHIARLTA